MRITPGCRPFVLHTSLRFTSLSFIFFIAVLLALICSVIPPSPFPLAFPLSTPLIQLRETLTNAHASNRQDVFPPVWLFQCHHLLSHGMRFETNIGGLEDEEWHAGEGRVVFISKLMTWVTRMRGFSCAPGCYFMDIPLCLRQKEMLLSNRVNG